MNQESGSLNFYIRDGNGQPQLIKFLSAESNNNDNATSGISNNIIKVSTLSDLQESSLDNQESDSNPPAKFSFSTNVNEINQKLDFKNAFSNNSTNRVPNRSLENISNLKRDRNERSGKGLRHFSMRVCEKVKQKGRTSYNEVADELVNEYAPATNGMTVNLQYDHKNIRRRVYDALNVLMAMNIIAKERKEIRWLGLPTNSMQECAQLEKEKQKRIESIKQKTQKLYDLMLRHIAYKNLVDRNRTHERFQGKPIPNSTVQMPFVVVNTDKKTVVDCSISQDKMEWLFRFNDKFVLHDDFTVLQKLGMTMGMEKIGTCNEETFEKAKALLPKILEQHLIHMATNMSIEEILNIDKITENPSTTTQIVDEDTLMFENDTSNMFVISDSSSPVHTYSDTEMTDSEAL